MNGECSNLGKRWITLCDSIGTIDCMNITLYIVRENNLKNHCEIGENMWQLLSIIEVPKQVFCILLQLFVQLVEKKFHVLREKVRCACLFLEKKTRVLYETRLLRIGWAP